MSNLTQDLNNLQWIDSCYNGIYLSYQAFVQFGSYTKRVKGVNINYVHKNIKKFVISQESKLKGQYGVKVLSALRKNTVIGYWKGCILHKSEYFHLSRDLRCENYSLSFSRENERNCKKIRKGDEQWIIIPSKECICSYINDGNHGIFKDKNCVNSVMNVIWVNHFPIIRCETIISIEADTEILCDYGDLYWK